MAARVIHSTGRKNQPARDITDSPSPTITVGGNDGGSGPIYHFKVVNDDEPAVSRRRRTTKPEYQVPTMTEIAAIPMNGYNVVSLFSGAGGSCLGFKMAGFRVLWANEFVSAAAETYRANHQGVLLDVRDIRKVQPQEILDAIGLRAGELDVLEGSPPCASFSTAGNVEEDWGKVKKYSDTKQRTDDLFFEYTRILRGLQPRVFVAENVSGLVKGVAKGFFLEILEALKCCGYNVKARLLDAQWLGVPQQRQRIIFIGVRDDLGIVPVHPSPFPYRYSVRDALPWVGRVRYNVGKESWGDAGRISSPSISASDAQRQLSGHFSAGGWVEAETDIDGMAIAREWDKLKPGQSSEKYLNLSKPSQSKPCPTVTARGGSSSSTASVTHPIERRKLSIAELKRICAFPDDFILTGNYGKQWERLGRSVPPLMMRAVAETIRDRILRTVERRVDACANSTSGSTLTGEA